MNKGTALRRAIKEFELPHPKFQEIAKRLDKYIEDANAGFDPRIEYVIGPSRVGKTALIKRLQRLHPGGREGTRRRVPVLFAKVMPGISWVMLPHGVIKALGVPPPRASAKSGEVTTFLQNQLRNAGTRTIIFEEASHLVDVGSRVPPRASGDWFKDLSEENDLTLIMFGVPRLQRLFQSNEQLDERASDPMEFRPYDSRIKAELDAFAGCVMSYGKHFKNYGFPFAVHMNDLVLQCYLLTGGLIGILSKFMRELAAALEYEAPRLVTWADCLAAATVTGSSGHPDFPPFAETKAVPIALNAAHAHVMEVNGMSLRAIAAAGAGK
jgi:hypothetical protein